jgi:prepilin signal peptidase PulO-like enzyme (type II secretory pathway)
MIIAITLAVLFYFGACIGSFLNVVIMRLPHNQTLMGRSYCMHCKRELEAIDLFPLFSYLFLAGKCRTCHKPISPRYFYMELLAGLLTILTYSFFVPFGLVGWLILARALIVVYALIVIFAIDYLHYLVLDSVVLWAAILTAVASGFIDYFSGNFGLHSSLILGLISGIGLALFFLLQYAFSKGRWIGFGDIKLALFLGLAIPFPSIVIMILLAYGLGAVIGIVLILIKAKRFSSEMPFGTFLAVATLISLYYGSSLTEWYLRITGLRNL